MKGCVALGPRRSGAGPGARMAFGRCSQRSCDALERTRCPDALMISKNHDCNNT